MGVSGWKMWEGVCVSVNVSICMCIYECECVEGVGVCVCVHMCARMHRGCAEGYVCFRVKNL